jgi:hypothetical protein
MALGRCRERWEAATLDVKSFQRCCANLSRHGTGYQLFGQEKQVRDAGQSDKEGWITGDNGHLL